MMKNITNEFSAIYNPVKALLFYQCDTGKESNIYIESYDIGKSGRPVNAHPLSANELIDLSALMQSAQELKTDYLKSEGLMPLNVLHINPKETGEVIWYTLAQEVSIYFSKALDLPCGKAKVPPMVWKAGKESVSVFALDKNKRPKATTALYHAPYFNIYGNGNVCMGTVDVAISQDSCLETFMQQWQGYFWNSYFSHLMEDFNPVTVNIVQLWKSQVEDGGEFPLDILKKTNYTLKDIL
jgi:PRTRC genetic system protein B